MPYGKMYEEKYAKELAVIRNAEKMGDREAAAREEKKFAAERAERAKDLSDANREQKGMEMRDMSNTHELGGSRRTRRRRKRKPSRRRSTTRKRTKRSRAKRSTKRRRTRGRK